MSEYLLVFDLFMHCIYCFFSHILHISELDNRKKFFLSCFTRRSFRYYRVLAFVFFMGSRFVCAIDMVSNSKGFLRATLKGQQKNQSENKLILTARMTMARSRFCRN